MRNEVLRRDDADWGELPGTGTKQLGTGIYRVLERKRILKQVEAGKSSCDYVVRVDYLDDRVFW